jgi:hypothetical protein
MEMKDMLNELLGILKAQNFQVKVGNNEIMLRLENKTFLINPCNQEGFGVMAVSMSLAVENMGQVGQIWNKAMSRYQVDPTYDDWYTPQLSLTLLPNQPAGPKRCILWARFDTYEDLKVNMTGENIKGWLERLRIVEEYIQNANKE